MKNLMKKFILIYFILFWGSAFAQPFTTVQGATVGSLVTGVLVGPGITVGPVTSTGGANQFGKFRNGLARIGLDSGMVLTTAALPAGTSTGMNTPSATFWGTTGTNITTYPLIAALVGTTINNVAAMQFTFVPLGDSIKFKYVFASEEYNEYVNSINDGFGFFISGPRPGGGFYVDQNIAIVPGTLTTPVTINNVNNGNAFGCTFGPCTNCAYYNDNLCAGSPTITNFCFDGFTDPLTARAAVIPCSTYTLKFAIANAMDQAFQSAVFLEARSFGTNFVLTATNNTVGAVPTTIYENCGTVTLDITRTTNLTESQTVYLTYSGTALNGIDVTTLPATLVFAPGATTVSLTIDPINDGITEILETLIINASASNCVGGSSSSITFNIIDFDPLTLNIPQDTMVMSCTGGTITATSTGGVPPSKIRWNSGPWLPNIAANQTTTWTGTASEWVVVSAVDTCGNILVDSVFIKYIEPEFVGYSFTPTITTGIEGCKNPEFIINRTENITLNKTYPISITGTALNGVDFTTILDSVIFTAGSSSTTFIVDALSDLLVEGTESITFSVNDTLCDGTLIPLSHTVYIKNREDISLEVGADKLIDCPRSNQLLSPIISGGYGTLTYIWSSGQTTANISVLPSDTTIYLLTVTDSCLYTATDSLIVNVVQDPNADFNYPNLLYCVPSEVSFTNLSTPGSGTILNYVWNFGDGNTSGMPNPTHEYVIHNTYDVQLIVTNSYNCVDTISQIVNIYPTPSGVPIVNPQNPTTLNPTVSIKDLGLNNTSWVWEIDNSSFTTQSFIYTFSGAGEYPGILTVTNQHGCVDTTNFTVIVSEETSLFIPNTFTPNGDFLNDLFIINGFNLVYVEITIYDRWGKEIFFSDKIEKAWGGYLDAGETVKAPIGVYAYRVYAIDTYGKEFLHLGQINLLR